MNILLGTVVSPLAIISITISLLAFIAVFGDQDRGPKARDVLRDLLDTFKGRGGPR
jgi:hypothetical protein